MMEKADQEAAAFAPRYQAGLAEEVKRIAALRQGREAIPAPAEELGGGPAAPAQAGDPRAAVMASMMSRFAPVQRVGDLEYAHMKKADEPVTLKPGEIRYTPGQPNISNPNAPLEHESALAKLLREKAKLPTGDPQHEAYDNAIRKASETAAQIVNVDNQPPITSVTIKDPKDPTGNNTIVVDGRTGRKIGDGPKLTDAGKLENKRAFNMQGIGATIQSIEDILSGKNGDPLPTESGIGSVVDTAAGIFGMSPKGSEQADKLRALGGALTVKMPRMEGPQSDRDVVLYKEMAGRVGDSTVPIARRKAALDTIKDLWAKYERLNPNAFTAGAASPAKPKAPRVVDW
jgi:hypothetical protein